MAGPEISSADDAAALRRLAAEEPGPEVVLYWGELHGIPAARELGAVGAGGDLFCDGSIGSHTAAWREPYADAPDTARRAALRRRAARRARRAPARRRGCRPASTSSATRPSTSSWTPSSWRRCASAATPEPGHRLEHAEAVRDPQRLARSGLLASVQPAFDAAWGGPDGMYAHRLGAERARGLNRFAELAAAGVPLAFGSDAPVTPLDPWGAVRAAAYPSRPGGGDQPALGVRGAHPRRLARGPARRRGRPRSGHPGDLRGLAGGRARRRRPGRAGRALEHRPAGRRPRSAAARAGGAAAELPAHGRARRDRPRPARLTPRRRRGRAAQAAPGRGRDTGRGAPSRPAAPAAARRCRAGRGRARVARGAGLPAVRALAAGRGQRRLAERRGARPAQPHRRRVSASSTARRCSGRCCTGRASTSARRRG